MHAVQHYIDAIDYQHCMSDLPVRVGHHGLDLDHERQERVKAVVALAATGNKGV
jgi:hypothetical protein